MFFSFGFLFIGAIVFNQLVFNKSDYDLKTSQYNFISVKSGYHSYKLKRPVVISVKTMVECAVKSEMVSAVFYLFDENAKQNNCVLETETSAQLLSIIPVGDDRVNLHDTGNDIFYLQIYIIFFCVFNVFYDLIIKQSYYLSLIIMTDFDNKFLNCFNWLKMNHFNHLHVHKILLVFGSLSIKNTLFTDFTKYLITLVLKQFIYSKYVILIVSDCKYMLNN